MPGITQRFTGQPLLKSRFLSHGTLASTDLAASRRFYEEVLGLEVVQQAPGALFIRLGSTHCYAVVEVANAPSEEMPLLNHNGIDLASDDEVDQAYAQLQAVKDDYGIRKMTKPAKNHGHYSFYVLDLDGNWWEIINLPAGGYDFRFTDPKWDLTGRFDLTEDEVKAVYLRKLGD